MLCPAGPPGTHSAISGIRLLNSTTCFRQMPSEESGPVTYAISSPVIPNLDTGQTEAMQGSHVADDKKELERQVEGARPQAGVFLALKQREEREVVSTCVPLPEGHQGDCFFA